MAEHEANELRQLMEQDLRELSLLLTGMGDGAAGQRAAPDARSTREVLACLSEAVRARFNGLGAVLRDPGHVLPPAEAAHVPEKVAAVVATCGSVSALIARCHADFEDLTNLVAEVASDRLAVTVRQQQDAGTVEVDLWAWVRAVFVEEFQEHLALLRSLREVARP
jgi:hypothetical protein